MHRTRHQYRNSPTGFAALLLLLVAGLGTAAPSSATSCWPGEPGSDPRLCPPDDPKFDRHWEWRGDIPPEVDRSKVHPAELRLGAIGTSVDRAWQLTTGRDEVVIAVLDSGIRWRDADLRRKLWLNAGELPTPAGSPVHDADGNGVFDVDDYAGDPRVGDRNGNGQLDPGDLIRVFSDGTDADANGYVDDISGYDFFGDPDNDAHDATDFGHGTGIAGSAAAETNNGLDDAGVCPRCRVLPVRVGDSFVVDANTFAEGVAFAVRSKAAVIASALGSYNNTPAARRAVDLAYEHGVVLIASAADEFSYHHNYPSTYNRALYVNSIRHNHRRDPYKASTFWGVNPCTNYGARVWVTVSANSCSSGATSRLAGIAGLLQSMALDAGRGPLHAEEVYQVLRATADDLDNSEPDWGPLRYPARPGFDQLYGYGRVNALRAVEAVRDGAIPPRVDLHGPRWFAVVSPETTPRLAVAGSVRLPRAERASYRLEYALGVEPREEEYVLVARGELAGDRSGSFGVLDFERLPVPSGPAPTGRADRDRYSVTLRLRVRDDGGRTAEARRSFFVLSDPAWKRHFPFDLQTSGEAAPLVADLDGDGKDEIVLATADGHLDVFRWDAAGLRRRRSALDPVRSADPAAGATPYRETVVREPVMGDLTGNGTPHVVLASRNGKVYVFDRRGERVPPFPVSVPFESTVGPGVAVERGVLSRPLLVDLDGRPGLEIVVAGLDGAVHAWRHDGSPLAGFPVTLENPRMPGVAAKIVSAPTAADLDGDGRPEIVVGWNGLHRGLSAVFALRAQGTRHPQGPYVPGWQAFEISALRPDLLPTLATGVGMSPLAVDADGDGDDEIVVYAVTAKSAMLLDHREGPRIVARYSMAPGRGSGFRGTTFLAGTGSGLIADTDGDGAHEFYAPLLPFRMLTLRSKPGVPIDITLALGGWHVGDAQGTRVVPMLDDFPRRMEDMMIFARPAAEDVDGDGKQEILMGSGGYLLHAFSRGAGEAAGFPKFTGGWVFSAAAVGDLDGDGRRELVAVTREGYLFAWELSGVAATVAGGESMPSSPTTK